MRTAEAFRPHDEETSSRREHQASEADLLIKFLAKSVANHGVEGWRGAVSRRSNMDCLVSASSWVAKPGELGWQPAS